MSDSDDTVATRRPAREASVASPVASVAVKKTVEEWATEKGYLPKQFPGTPPNQDRVRVIPGTGPKPNPKYERFYAAKCGSGWVVGVELTEAEFDEAMTLIDKPIR